MAYTPTEWETGDVITAEKLNNIEDGIVANEEASDAHAKDTLVFNGTIEIPITLDSGTVTITDEVPEDLLDYKYVGLALDVPSLQTPGTFMARLILPLYVVTYGGANIASCQFKCSFEVLSHIVHVDILYQYATETWSATVTSESA